MLSYTLIKITSPSPGHLRLFKPAELENAKII